MVLLRGCPPWEYTDVPQHSAVLQVEVSRLLRALFYGSVSMDAEGRDSRHVHEQLFRQLVPLAHLYYAGHYRGENYPCLLDYEVTVGDPMVGTNAPDVAVAMTDFADSVRLVTAAVDASFAGLNAGLSEKEKLYHAVVVAARVFQEFLTIHPYANGNGHIARFLVWLMLGRYRYWPRRWTIDPNPNISGYYRALIDHRRGSVNPLEALILASMVP